jgi:hypothetical protein
MSCFFHRPCVPRSSANESCHVYVATTCWLVGNTSCFVHGSAGWWLLAFKLLVGLLPAGCYVDVFFCLEGRRT